MASCRVTPPTDFDLPTSAPAPWTLKGDMFWLILTLKNPLPADMYDPLTAAALDKQSNDFRGGLGMIQVIQYHDSPVGQYNELLIIPGNFTVPGGDAKGKRKLRISRIYVDSEASCFNGRRDWSIPKHMARFEWTISKEGERRVSVFAPDTPEGVDTIPFFSATLAPLSWCPTFPLSTKYLPLDTTLVQPPLPTGAESYLPGTNTWKLCRLVASTNRAKMIWAKIDLPEGSSKHWPQVQPWSLGVFLEKGELTIERPDEFSI